MIVNFHKITVKIKLNDRKFMKTPKSFFYFLLLLVRSVRSTNKKYNFSCKLLFIPGFFTVLWECKSICFNFITFPPLLRVGMCARPFYDSVKLKYTNSINFSNSQSIILIVIIFAFFSFLFCPVYTFPVLLERRAIETIRIEISK